MGNVQLWVSVLEIGSFFALMGLGFLLIRLGTNFFNFALGAYATVAALSTTWLVRNAEVPLWAAVAFSLVIAVLLSVGTELGLVRIVQVRSPHEELPALISVAALLFFIAQIAGNIFGRAPQPGQHLVTGSPIRIGSAVVTPGALLLIGVTIVAFVGATLWMRISTMGRLLRAVGDNREAAVELGVPVGRIRVAAFILGGLVVGVAGILFASKNGVAFSSALDWTLLGFLALVIGGTGRAWAPLVGGLLLGAVQVFTPYYLPHFSPTIGIFIVAIVFFAFKPEGLFVRKVRV